MSAYLSIRSMAARTGLTVHTIRAWERRYGALIPERTDTNRRLYTEEDAERLTLMRQVVDAGHSIGQIVKMPLEELARLASFPSQAHSAASSPVSHLDNSLLLDCELAVDRLDADKLDQVLAHALMQFGVETSIDQVVLPLLSLLDRRYEAGTYHMAHEHLLSTTVRAFLDRIRRSLPQNESGQKMIVTTPAGQTHEIGALLVCIFSAMQGWQVTYLGPNLPAEEIATAVRLSGAQLVALSIVFVASAPDLNDELRKLRQALGAHTAILVGGRAAVDYAEVINEVRGERIDDIQSLKSALNNL